MSQIKSHNTGSMDTFKKVLRFIGRYRFLLMISVMLRAVSVLLSSTYLFFLETLLTKSWQRDRWILEGCGISLKKSCLL